MATPTLDEIEAGLDVVEPYLTHDYQRSLLALVAHVRALQEHAAQSKALVEALLLGKDALFSAQAREQKLAEENAELRKQNEWMVKTQREPQWPAPQPIETAPLGRILVVFEGGQMEVIRPVKVDTESSWREFLKMNKATHWWPVPPPPGGGK